MYELGPDGSYDAISYYKKYGGYFEWYRKVDIADNHSGKNHRKQMQELQMYHAAQDSATFPDYVDAYSARKIKKLQKQRTKTLNKQRKATEKGLREAGIKLEKE